MRTVGPSDSNHAIEHALTDGKWLYHRAQFWLQEAQCLEVLKDCDRERHRGLIHAATGGIFNLNWKWVNRIFCSFYLLGSLSCGIFLGCEQKPLNFIHCELFSLLMQLASL